MCLLWTSLKELKRINSRKSSKKDVVSFVELVIHVCLIAINRRVEIFLKSIICLIKKKNSIAENLRKKIALCMSLSIQGIINIFQASNLCLIAMLRKKTEFNRVCFLWMSLKESKRINSRKSSKKDCNQSYMSISTNPNIFEINNLCYLIKKKTEFNSKKIIYVDFNESKYFWNR